MKTLNIIVTLLVLFTTNVFGQNIQKLNSYKEFISVGKYNNGKKVGEWIDISIDSIIYVRGSYDSTGNPIGTWSVYYPDGSLRKTTEYKNRNVVRWCCYNNNQLEIEISNPEKINFEIYGEILLRETYYMELNNNPGERIYYTPSDFPGWMYEKKETLYIDHVFFLYYDLSNLLKQLGFNGTLTKYGPYKKLLNQHEYLNGDDFEKRYEYNIKGLVRLKEYRNGTLLKVTHYDKEGKIIKVLEM